MGVIINDVSDYINLFVRMAHVICNHTLYGILLCIKFSSYRRVDTGIPHPILMRHEANYGDCYATVCIS
jgi:hypothetical protein